MSSPKWMFTQSTIPVQYFQFFRNVQCVLTTFAVIILHVRCMNKPNVLTEFAVVTARYGMNILLYAATRNE
jgi:hypothetical protein